MPISRSQMPRQMYGLGSFVKSIGKGIKKIVKSPIGKAAILGFGANALIPGGLSSLFSGSSLPGMFGKATNFIKGLSGKQLLGAGSLGLAALASAPEEVQMESSTDVGALRKYLTSYYQNLGYSADQIAENVARDTSEYTSGQGGYANGGRIGYDDGTNPKKDFLVKKGYGDMVKNMSVIEIDQLFNSVKGTTTAANTYREPAYMGGRMGYAEGPKDPTYTGNNMEDLPRGLQIDTTTSNPIPNDAPQKEISEVAKIMLGPGRSGIGEPEDGTMKGYQFFRTQYLPKKVKEIAENYGMKESEVLTMIREEMMKYIDAPESLEKPKMAYGGRINRAFGSDELVEQASGIEGLDININPKGVKELDLRETGGFIPPVGVKEKADDIPAMLSNNEFVFTADAVRAAGGGSVNKGAQIMYDTMKKLENGGTV